LLKTSQSRLVHGHLVQLADYIVTDGSLVHLVDQPGNDVGDVAARTVNMRGRSSPVVKVMCVHGVAQQRETENTLRSEWAPALCGGLQLAGGHLAEASVVCVLYGDLFRPPGRRLAPGDPLIRPADLDQFEQDLLVEWWIEAARTDPLVISPGARALARAPRSVQAALRALSGSRFFAGLSERALLGDLRQVRRYFDEPQVRQAAQDRVAAMMDDDVRVIVGHSLGSVVAYEALCMHPNWPVRALVTLGSPLGIPNLIFERLCSTPQPIGCGQGELRAQWPGNVRSWSNVADENDVVALVKDLRPTFGPDVDCWIVDNGARAHDVKPYLTALETGRAILTGLMD
jgi:hypothetical protein